MSVVIIVLTIVVKCRTKQSRRRQCRESRRPWRWRWRRPWRRPWEVEEALEVEGEENMRQLLDRALFQVQWTFLSAVSCVICVVQCAVCSRPRHY